jgi:hypothetical protein
VAWEACQPGAVLLLVCIRTVLDHSQSHIKVRVLLVLPEVGEGQRHLSGCGVQAKRSLCPIQNRYVLSFAAFVAT